MQCLYPGQITVKWEKFKFPALFSPASGSTSQVQEINVPDHDPDHHQKFCDDWPRQLGLVRTATERQTDRQTDYITSEPCPARPPTFPNWPHPTPSPPPLCQGCITLRMPIFDTIFVTNFQLETPVKVLLRGGSCMWARENSKMMCMAQWSPQLIIMDPENMTYGLNIGTPIKLLWRNMVVLGAL